MIEEIFQDLDALDLGRSVVDVGAGFGASTEYLLRRGVRVCAVDVDPGAVTSLRSRFRQFVEIGMLRLDLAPAEALPYRDAACDSAISVVALHHFKDVRRALLEMERVARRLVVVYDWAPGAGGVINPHSPEELRQKMETAVEIAKTLGFEYTARRLWYRLLKRKTL
jgi:ubiquinone/menaquinone biosynthesis C-methylase UbiE